jgi:hypothetical protein
MVQSLGGFSTTSPTTPGSTGDMTGYQIVAANGQRWFRVTLYAANAMPGDLATAQTVGAKLKDFAVAHGTLAPTQ